MTSPPRRLPASTYRLQLHRGFPLARAEALLPYLDGLGVSHLYLSPVTAAAPGSLHGYDVVDPSQVNPELGGEEALRSLARAARSRGMGLILDIVPNHMSTAEANWRWTDVLRHGRASRYAHWFDVDWDASDELAHRGKVLLPVLGDHLDAVLTRGELTVEADEDGGWLRYYERRFPLAPGTRAGASGDLSGLLEAQHYVLGYWLTAKSHVDYRRFFTVDELIGVRVEEAEVFAATHDLFGRLAAGGLIDGVRVDHADGLSDPLTYFRRLRALLGPAPYIVAEKILGPHEQLPGDWPIDGTTGYEFMADVAALQTDDAQREAFEAVYTDATGRRQRYEDVAQECRVRVLDGPLAGQLRRATRQLHRTLTEPPPFEAFAAAVRALIACLPVYRTYHNEAQHDPRASGVIEEAHREAARRHPEAGPPVLRRVATVLARPEPAARIAVMRLQQLMPAVAAKAVEDSAFYRYIPLLSLNEVGGDPVAFRADVPAFHARNVERARRWPGSMLATATHDHKRGEDVRARLGALSEQPAAWRTFLEALRETAGRPPAPIDPIDEYRAAQTLLGIWPLRAEDGDDLSGRLAAYLVKSAREAGERTSWDRPDAGYEAALEAHAAAAVEAMRALPEAQQGWLARISRNGIDNSIAQVVLRVLSSGVPDTYQGTEFWDESLVDPDNRRPVDYEARDAVLADLRPYLDPVDAPPEARRDFVLRLASRPEDPALKLYVLARALGRRRALHPLCVDGEYLPLEVRGPEARHVVAFARRLGDRWLVAVTTVLPATLARTADGTAHWDGTEVVLPASLHAPLIDAFTGVAHTPVRSREGGMLPVSAVLSTLPAALLEPAAQ